MNETPIKNGAEVFLVGEGVIARGDLYAYWTESGFTLALHYVTPFRSAPFTLETMTQEQSDSIDSFFHTDRAPENQVLNIAAAQVMTINPAYSDISNEVLEQSGHLEEMKQRVIKSALERMFGNINVVSVDELFKEEEGKKS